MNHARCWPGMRTLDFEGRVDRYLRAGMTAKQAEALADHWPPLTAAGFAWSPPGLYGNVHVVQGGINFSVAPDGKITKEDS